jgi:hypothetical protein
VPRPAGRAAQSAIGARLDGRTGAPRRDKAMAEVKAFPLDGGGHVLVEVYEAEGVQRVSRGEEVKKTFEEAWKQIRPAITAVVQQLEEISPQEFEVTFGIKLGADFDAWIAKAHGEANFEVKMTWKAE